MVNVLGQAIPTVAQLVLVPVYLRTIGEARYGVLLLAITMLNYFIAFDLGLGRAVTQRVSAQDDEHDRNRTFCTALVLAAGTGFVGAAALYFGGDLLLPYLLKTDAGLLAEASRSVIWLALMVPLSATMSVMSGALQARHAFVALNTTQVVGTLGVQALPLFVALSGRSDISSMLAAALAGRFVGWLVSFVSVIKVLPLHAPPRFSRGEVAVLVRFGRWVSGAQLMVPLLTVVDRLVISARWGASAIAAYSIPFSFTQRFYYLPMGLSTTLFPRLSRQSDAENQLLLDKSIRALVALQTPLLLFAVLLLPPFFRVWLGSALATRAVPVAIVFVISIWFNGPVYVSYDYLVARGRPDLMMKFYMVELVPFLALLWWLVATFGIVGAAMAWVVRSAADACFCLTVSGTFRIFLRAIVVTVPGVVLATGLALLAVSESLRIAGTVAALVATTSVCWKILPQDWRARLRWRERLFGRS
jgi:O-antigen/teichoic acid export membrane protein